MESAYDPLDGVVHASRSLTSTLESWAERRKTGSQQPGKQEMVVTTAAGGWGARTEVAQDSGDGDTSGDDKAGDSQVSVTGADDSPPTALGSPPSTTAAGSAARFSNGQARDGGAASALSSATAGSLISSQAVQASAAAASTAAGGRATVTHQPQELRPPGKLKIYLLPLPGRFNFHLLQVSQPYPDVVL